MRAAAYLAHTGTFLHTCPAGFDSGPVDVDAGVVVEHLDLQLQRDADLGLGFADGADANGHASFDPAPAATVGEGIYDLGFGADDLTSGAVDVDAGVVVPDDDFGFGFDAEAGAGANADYDGGEAFGGFGEASGEYDV